MFTSTKPRSAGQIFLIEADKIHPNRNQPREHFDMEKLKALSDSIRKNGMLQPLTVRRYGTEYELIAGERRLRAALMARMGCVPCIIMETDDKSSAIFALIENIQRQELNFIEEARAIQMLSTRYGMTQDNIAIDIGKTQAAVSNLLRILRLPENIQQGLLDYGLTQRHARILLTLPGELQAPALKEMGERRLSVREAESLARRLTADGGSHRQNRKIFFKDVRIFVNTVNHAVDVMRQAGIRAGLERTETDEEYRFVVTVPKNR